MKHTLLGFLFSAVIISITPPQARASTATAISETTVIVNGEKTEVKVISESTSSPIPWQVRTDKIKETLREAQEKHKEIRELYKEDPLKRTEELKKIQEQTALQIQHTRLTYRNEIAKRHGERLEKRFQYYQERLTNIALRIQSRIDKEKAEGKEVATAQEALNKGKVTLVTAASEGKKAISLFTSIPSTSWELQKPEIKAAIDQAQRAQKLFRDAKQEMMTAVSELTHN